MENYSSQFSEILDRCLDDVQSGRSTIEECLQRHSALRDELEPQLRLALRLSAARSMEAPDHLRTAGWERIQAQIGAYQVKPAQKNAMHSPYPLAGSAGRVYHPEGSASQPDHRPVRRVWKLNLTAAALIVLIILLTSSGVVYASNQALPGDTFYTLKLAFEEVQLRLAAGELRQASVHLDKANHRLDELEALPRLDQPALVERTLINYTEHVTAVLENIAFLGQFSDPEQVDFARTITFELGRNDERLGRIQERLQSTDQVWFGNARAASTIGLRFVEYILEKSLAMRGISPQEVVPTSSGGPQQETPTPTQLFLQAGQTTSTPTPSGTPTSAATPVVWLTPDPLEWLDLLPSRPRLATIWATIYPTLSNLATQFPRLTGTPIAPVRPTHIKPTLIPTEWPLPGPAPSR